MFISVSNQKRCAELRKTSTLSHSPAFMRVKTTTSHCEWNYNFWKLLTKNWDLFMYVWSSNSYIQGVHSVPHIFLRFVFHSLLRHRTFHGVIQPVSRSRCLPSVVWPIAESTNAGPSSSEFCTDWDLVHHLYISSVHVFLRSFRFLLSCVKNNNLNNKTPHFGKRTVPGPQAKNTVKLSLLIRTRYVQLSSDIDLFMTRLIQINNVARALKQHMNISKSEYDFFFLVAVSPQKFAKSKRAVFWWWKRGL
jgi:hypothetical protein